MAGAKFEILSLDESFVAIEKPPGFHVHQPEYPRRRVSPSVVCLPILRDQLGLWLYPVHRLDVGTEGVLLFALTKEAAGNLCRQFQNSEVTKTYFAIVRGFSPDEGVIDLPLALDSTGEMAESLTRFRTHARTELPVAVGKRHETARYSLVEARPETGRFHQVRRHMARLAHPLAGDCVHGDSHHNRFFRTELASPGLWLKAKSIEFRHPVTDAPVRLVSSWSERWQNVFLKLGFPTPELNYPELK
jgi:tRNA pseudouridine65 synthase